LDAIKLYSREAQAKQFANVFKKCLNSKI